MNVWFAKLPYCLTSCVQLSCKCCRNIDTFTTLLGIQKTCTCNQISNEQDCIRKRPGKTTNFLEICAVQKVQTVSFTMGEYIKADTRI